jgi:hypothetical protein
MTVDYSRVAATDIRNAIWAELQANNILKTSDYNVTSSAPGNLNGPVCPIIPSQQIPEFNNLLPGKTYITYDIIQRNFGTQWWMSQESMVMQIVSRNNQQIMTIVNFLTDFVRRYELSAADINTYGKNANSPFKFLWCRLESANPVQPFKDEGGFMSGDFSFMYVYTRSVDEGPNYTGRYV